MHTAAPTAHEAPHCFTRWREQRDGGHVRKQLGKHVFGYYNLPLWVGRTLGSKLLQCAGELAGATQHLHATPKVVRPIRLLHIHLGHASAAG